VGVSVRDTGPVSRPSMWSGSSTVLPVDQSRSATSGHGARPRDRALLPSCKRHIASPAPRRGSTFTVWLPRGVPARFVNPRPYQPRHHHQPAEPFAGGTDAQRSVPADSGSRCSDRGAAAKYAESGVTRASRSEGLSVVQLERRLRRALMRTPGAAPGERGPASRATSGGGHDSGYASVPARASRTVSFASTVERAGPTSESLLVQMELSIPV